MSDTSTPRLLVSPADPYAAGRSTESGDSLIGVDPDRGRVVWLMDPDVANYVADVLDEQGMPDQATELRAASLSAVNDIAALERL